MPFKSKAQARFMFARHPEMAKRWAKHTKSIKALPEKKEAAALLPMEKVAVADLLKLDAKGISLQALRAIYTRNMPDALRTPGVLALVAGRQERLRRLSDELRNPLSHLKQPTQPKFMPPGAEADMMPPAGMPMAPGMPTPPSNLLGMFPQDQAAAGMGGMMGGGPGGMMGGGMGGMMGGPMPKLGADMHDEAEQRHKAQAFKYGFCLKLAECGVTPAEFVKAAVNPAVVAPIAAAGAVSTVAKDTDSLAKWILDKVIGTGKLAIKTPMVLAPLLGMAAGGAYRFATAPGYETPKELRDIEQTALYKRLSHEAQGRATRLRGKREAKETKKLPPPSADENEPMHALDRLSA